MLPSTRDAIIRARVNAGWSDAQIADALGVSSSTILRRRRVLDLGSRWTPDKAPHGTRSRYQAGCSCGRCSGANRLYQASMRAAYQRARTIRQEAATDN